MLVTMAHDKALNTQGIVCNMLEFMHNSTSRPQQKYKKLDLTWLVPWLQVVLELLIFLDVI